MAESPRDLHVLDRRVRPRCARVGRRRPVEVPGRRRGRAGGGAGGRGDRDAGLGEPRLPAGRAGSAPRGVLGGGRRAGARRRRRRARAPAGRSRGRARARGDVHRRGVPGLGGRDDRAGVRGAGEHPRLRGDGGGAGLVLRGLDGTAACRAAPRPASPPRRQPAATGGAGSPLRSSSSARTAATAGRATSPSTSASTTIRSRSRSWQRIYAPPRPPLRADAGRGVAGRRRRARGRAVRAPGRARLRRTELPDALAAWAGTENLEERVRGADRIDPVVLEGAARRGSRAAIIPGWRPRPRGRSSRSSKARRSPSIPVTPLELFFDLVFVFALTQVTGFMSDDPTWEGIGRGMLILAALWWAWGAYAWLTNEIDPNEGSARLRHVRLDGRDVRRRARRAARLRRPTPCSSGSRTSPSAALHIVLFAEATPHVDVRQADRSGWRARRFPGPRSSIVAGLPRRLGADRALAPRADDRLLGPVRLRRPRLRRLRRALRGALRA